MHTPRSSPHVINPTVGTYLRVEWFDGRHDEQEHTGDAILTSTYAPVSYCALQKPNLDDSARNYARTESSMFPGRFHLERPAFSTVRRKSAFCSARRDVLARRGDQSVLDFVFTMRNSKSMKESTCMSVCPILLITPFQVANIRAHTHITTVKRL